MPGWWVQCDGQDSQYLCWREASHKPRYGFVELPWKTRGLDTTLSLLWALVHSLTVELKSFMLHVVQPKKTERKKKSRYGLVIV